MRAFPKLLIVDPTDDDAVIVELSMVAESEVGAFTAEIAHEIGALIGVNREVALHLFAVTLRDSIALPVPDRFELSAQTRRGFAKDVAAVIRTAIGASAKAAA